jgi:hypothetical protein
VPYVLQKEFEVLAPLSEVWATYLDLDLQIEWQDDFTGYEIRTGVSGEVGCVTELQYEIGGKEVLSISTVLERKEFELHRVECDFSGTVSIATTRFEAIDFDSTSLTVVQEIDLDDVPFWKRPMVKGVVKMMNFVIFDDFKTFTEERFHGKESVA